MPAALLLVTLLSSASEPALSLGGGRCGALQGGQAVKCRGDNFESASSLTCEMGRNHLHPLVVATVEDAYALLQQSHPQRQWQYGEMGWKDGGSFKPHQTHQSGRSADFFFPAVDAQSHPALLPISPLNLLGYRLHFRANGTLDGDLRLDPAAVAAHLLALQQAGAPHGVTIQRVILDAPFQKQVLAAQPRLQSLRDRFNTRPVWIAHDQHYHVDFDIPARFKRPRKC